MLETLMLCKSLTKFFVRLKCSIRSIQVSCQWLTWPLLDPKRVTIKMSLVSFSFNEVVLTVVTVVSKEWCRAKEVCKALNYERKRGNVIKEHCSRENIAHKYQLIMVTATVTTINWSKDSKKYEFYITEEGLYEFVFSSQQPLAKSNVMFLHIRQPLRKKKQH